MEIKPLHRFPRETVEQLLSAIPFYKTVRQQDPWQFELLLQHSRVQYFKPGEVVLRRGEEDPWLYFLLKGHLVVYADEPHSSEPVNYITPGEVFGDLARLVGQPRTATLLADTNCREVMVFATDISAFGPLRNTQRFSLQTKLAYYRNTVHNLRWKLEVYRSRHPEHAFANRHRQVRLFTGKKDTIEELESLHAQAQALARLLLEWNSEFGNLTTSPAPSQSLVSALEK